MPFLLTNAQVAQIAVCVFFFIVYAIMLSAKEREADYISTRYLIILCDFAIKHHPSFPSLETLAVVNVKEVDAPGRMQSFLRFRTNFDLFRESHDFSILSKLPDVSSSYAHLILVLFAPIWSVALYLIEQFDSVTYHKYKLQHTAKRKNRISTLAMLVISNFVWCTGAIIAISQGMEDLGMVLIAIVVIGLIANCFSLFYIVNSQIKWKQFWTEVMIEIAGGATKNEDHDLFNRSMILKNQIDAEPDIPLPANIAFYSIVVSAINYSIGHLFEYLNL